MWTLCVIVGTVIVTVVWMLAFLRSAYTRSHVSAELFNMARTFCRSLLGKGGY